MMNYTLMPSLKHIALIKITTTLWNQHDIKDLLAKLCFPFGSEGEEKWQEIESEVIVKVLQLSLPKDFKKEILGFLKPIGLQILKWMEYLFESHVLYLRGDISIKLSWTPQGIVNKKKTVETLIKGENLDIVRRYKLACIYCLEDDIPELWNKLSEEDKKYIYPVEDSRMVYSNKLVSLWTYDIEGEVSGINNMIKRSWQHNCSLSQYAFEYAATGGNEAATRYFLPKLTPMEREKSLVNITGRVVIKRCVSDLDPTDFPKEYYSHVLCFLLSQMNEEQQIEVFKSHPSQVLMCFLDWPGQQLFMKIANHMWSFLYRADYSFILREMVSKSYVIYNYEQLFAEFWQQCPHAHKKCVLNKFGGNSLLSKLIQVEDKKNISLILKEATVAEKEKIIFQLINTLCKDLDYSSKWNLLEHFISECISSKEVMLEFKDTVERRINTSRKLLQMLDDFIEKYDKKISVEEGDNSSTKRLHNTEFEEVIHV